METAKAPTIEPIPYESARGSLGMMSMGAEVASGSRVALIRALLIFLDGPGDAAAYFFITSNPFA